MSAADWSRPGSSHRPSVGGHVPATVTSATAGWALGWALVGCCYIGTIVSTVLALRVLAHRRATGEDQGSGLAIAALAVNAVAVGSAALVAYVWLVVPEPSRGASPAIGVYDALPHVNGDPDVIASIADIEANDCIVLPALRGEEDADHRVNCEDSHDLESIGIVVLDDETFPGDAALERRGARQCRGPEFREWVGIPLKDSELEVTWVAPDEDDWEDGERIIFCFARDPAGPVDESFYGSRR